MPSQMKMAHGESDAPAHDSPCTASLTEWAGAKRGQGGKQKLGSTAVDDGTLADLIGGASGGDAGNGQALREEGPQLAGTWWCADAQPVPTAVVLLVLLRPFLTGANNCAGVAAWRSA